MRLSRVLTDMLVLIDPNHALFVEERGAFVVETDKALYGCVEAAALLYSDLCATMKGDYFTPISYEPCVYNKIGTSGTQVTVVMHVDDLSITSLDEIDHEEFENNMRRKYREVKVNKGKVVNYTGMSFNFDIPGQVSITIENSERSIMPECGVWPMRSTPVAPTLFETRDAPKATTEEVKLFRTFVAKLLHLAKMARPE
jgi:hypothetical protein